MTNITNGPWKGKASDVTVSSDALYTLLEVPIREGASAIAVNIENSADEALQEFEVQYLAHSDGSYVTIASTDSDFTTVIENPILASTADLTALPASTDAFLYCAVKGVNRVRLQAKSASASDAVLAAFWQVR